MKYRKTTHEERILIVKDCIQNQLNYKQTAQKYNVSYSFASVNESINHLVTSGEAHVKGLNFVKLVNYLINKNGNGLFVNYKAHKAEAAAENDGGKNA